MKINRTITALALLGLGMGAAQAGPTFCSIAGDPNPDGLSTSDMSWQGSNSADCYGVAEQKTHFDNFSSDSIQTMLNTGAVSMEWGSGWTFLVKDDGDVESENFMGVDFQLDADIGDKSGSWTLSWSGSGLPLTLDLVGTLGGGSKLAAYLFEGVNFLNDPAQGTGSFEISFTNPGNANPELSNLNLFGRATDELRPPAEIPTPAPLALLGLGLVGMYLLRNRKQAL